ncbi:hypothetical protein ACH518_09310 [Methylomonas sp. HW2-6]|uniref:hypothetical protein n=1 Tax=Methylomonas sp. HW2-6 TaxID=3376687 RepID=UPI003D4E8492|nr:hypothetical protein C2U68_13880 [Methylomonas koyamae]
MDKIDFGQNCPLTRYLQKISMLDAGGRKSQFAGALLCGFGYPDFIRNLPDVTFTAQLLRSIAESGQIEILSDAANRCTECPELGRCEIGTQIMAASHTR